MLPSPPAAFASATYAVDVVFRPPWLKALQSPKAAGPVASGPTAARVAGVSGSSDLVGDGLGVRPFSLGGVGLGEGDSVSVAVGAW
jgi:hypothetical protein